MSLLQVVRRYAEALYEVASERDEVDVVADDMATLAQTFRELPEVLAWCQEGRTHSASAETFVATAFVPLVGSLTGSTLRIAARYDRLAALPFLPQAFQEVADRHSDTVRVTLETAQDPEQDLLDGVVAAMGARSRRRVVVTPRVVPELVAGFRLLWDDRMLDATARERLRILRLQLTSD